jgi:hypothetical protein
MNEFVSENQCRCPFCAERITLVVDYSGGPQRYIEDCQVCCQPMEVTVEVEADGQRSVSVERAS